MVARFNYQVEIVLKVKVDQLNFHQAQVVDISQDQVH